MCSLSYLMCSMINNINFIFFIHSLIHSFIQVVDALSRKLAAVDDICEEIKLDLAEDYLANMRRPNFNLFELHTKLQKLGITDETVLKHLNAMWVEVLEETLMEGETAAANPGRAPMDRTQTEIAYAEVGEE
eukprot:GHVU01005851.1.p3 GENE.GHVU01005851.1~~GHVU01005851.1.p3  ORF type:complete len:132 (+),score=31.42 GHVU01005851.1:1109-1504(+)